MKKIIFLTLLTSLTILFRLNAQTSDNLDALLITSDNELTKYSWYCSKLLPSDTLFLDNDSIVLTKGIEIENNVFYIDTSYKRLNKLEVMFDKTNNSFIVIYFEILKSVKNKKNSNNNIEVHYLYKSDSLKWSFDRSSQLLKISATNNNSWTYFIKEIDKDRLLLINKRL